MRSTCTLLSDVTEMSEDSYSSCQTTSPKEALRVPFIEIEPFDETPFSESFSGIFDLGDLDPKSNSNTADIRLNNDTSYNVDRITDIQELDSDFEDDDIDEIVIISRKTSKPSKDARDRKKLLDNVFSLSEFDFLDRLNPRETTSGTYVVRKRDTNRVYTMKAFRATRSLNWPFELCLLEMLTEQDCVFLPCILRRIFEHQALFVLLDSYPAGNMLDYVLQDGALDPDEVLFYSSEITEALSALHDAKIEHRDINPANVMINTDGHIVLLGFDLAKVNGKESLASDQVQRPPRDYEYRAPEVLLRWEHDFLVDCWGLGCLMYFMTYGKHPFPLTGFTQAQVYKQVLRGGSLTVPCDGRMDAAARDLMFKCLERNPRLRPNIEEIKQHKYFASIDWATIQKKTTPAPYIPSFIYPNLCETFYKCSPEFRPRSLDRETEAGTAIVQTSSVGAEWDPSKSISSKPRSVYSLQARHSVQDLLPLVFRSPSLDELKMDMNQSRLMEEHSVSISKSVVDSITDRAPSYESLRRSPVVNKLSREERLSLFWETLDKDVNTEAPKPARVLGIPFSSSERQLQEPLAPPKLRRQRSSIITQTNHRLSQLVSLSTSTQNKLRKLRRPKSTPAFSHPDVIMRSGSKFDEYELPSGIKQIGSGIGFTYTVPAASGSKSSICIPGGAPKRSHSKLPVLGLGLGLRTLSGGILRSKSRREGHGQAGPEYSRPSQDLHMKMNSVPEDIAGEMEAEEQDIFRYGSTWSLMPGDACCRIRVPVSESDSPCLEQVSPVTATDSTAYSPLTPGFSPLPLSPGDVNFDTLLGIAREVRPRIGETGRLDGLLGSSATLRLISS